MRQTNAFLPVYAADNSAMCSALYELGGLVVMHDASGCNSTYTTHDEPRWFDRPSLVTISGLTEMDAVLGNERRLIDDIVKNARDFNPAFIALGGTPIPMMMGCDYEGLAREIEHETGIVTMGIDTNGTKDYISGADKSFGALLSRFALDKDEEETPDGSIRVNILGATPLDLSLNDNRDAIAKILTDAGYTVNSVVAMGSTLAEISRAGNADVNVVITGAGMKSAQLLRECFGTPFVIGSPVGRFMTSHLIDCIEEAYRTGACANLAVGCRGNENTGSPVYVVGEAVTAAAMRAALIRDEGMTDVRVLTAVTCEPMLLAEGDRKALCEDDFIELLPKASMVIADPLFRLVAGSEPAFVDLPHEAMSGRMWHDDMPVWAGEEFNLWFAARMSRDPLIAT